MNNQLVKERARYLYTIGGQPYRAEQPATPGYWRTVQGSAQTAWVRVTKVVRSDYPIRGSWAISLYWTDPFKGKNMEWYGEAPKSQPINIPYLLRYYGEREEIQVYGPARTERVWVPGTPYQPEQPYIPDQPVYESIDGWNAGARAIRSIPQEAQVRWKVSPTARGVVVGLTQRPAEGAYWQYPIGVKAIDGVAHVVALGAEVKSLGIFTAKTVFRIQRTDGDINVYVNEVLRHTVPDLTRDALLMDVSLYASGDSMHDPAISLVGSGQAHGTLRGLQGLAQDEVVDGSVLLRAEPLIFSIVAEQGGDGQAHGTLPGLAGVAADSDSYAFTTGTLAPVQGQAMGFTDLPALENPTYIHAVMPSMSAEDAPVSIGVQSAQMAWLLGMASDDDVAVAYGVLPLCSISAEEENADEDTLSIRQRPTTTMRSQSVQEAGLREQLSAWMTLGASHISLAPIATHVRATEGMASSGTTSAGVHALARLVSGAALSLPHQDDDAVTQVCHEKGGFVTHYSSYNFDAFAQIGGRYYGVAADGVYLLEGESDEGQAITARIDFGTQKLSSAELKSIPAVYAGMASTQAATLVVGTRQGEYRYVQRGYAPRLQTQRFDLGRGLRDTHYDFALEVPAAGLELDNMEFGATKSTRRI